MTTETATNMAKSLKARALGAGGWSIAGHFASTIIRFASTLILSRIFSPGVFGQVAFLISIQVIIALLTDIGLRQSVIHHRNGDDPIFLSTAWTLQVIRGCVITCIGALIAAILYLLRERFPPGSVYAEPEMPLYLAVSLLSATIVGFQSMRLILASRRIQLAEQIAIELLVQIAQLIFIIIGGFLTHSIWAYIGGILFGAAVNVILSHIMLKGPRDRFAWDRPSLREMSHFGKWTIISTAMTAFSGNGDRLLLGGWLTVDALGSYSIANNLRSIADGLIGRVYGSIAFPALTETAHRDPSRVRTIFFRMRLVIDSTMLLASGFLFISGETIVHLMYDSRYASAGSMLSLLSIGLIFSRYEICQSAYLALGRPSYITLLSVVKLVSLFTIAPLGYWLLGVDGAILGIALSMFPAMICSFVLNRKHQLNSLVFEVLILSTWAMGWAAGLGFNGVVMLFRH